MVPRFMFLVKRPFIWFILISIYVAYLYPAIGAKGGLLKPEVTVKYFAVSFIFFFSGLSLKTVEFTTAFRQFHLHLFIEGFTFIFIPLIVQLLILFLGDFYPNKALLIGFITVSCMPPPVSSAVILTKAADGNEAGAVFNSALGSFLGIFLTPGLLFLFLGYSGEVPFLNAVFQLSITIILPVIIGQYCRMLISDFVQHHRNKLSVISKFLLLLIIYTTFCDTFSESSSMFNSSIVFITLAAVIAVQCLLMIIVFYTTTNFNSYFSSDDTVAALFCATHKSLTLGFPLLKIFYNGETKFSLISFPLLVYHPTQILLGSLLVPFLQEWNQQARKRKITHPV